LKVSKLTTALITLTVALILTLAVGATDVSLPIVKSDTPTTPNIRADAGHTDLWLAFVELAQHCVQYDEIMDCAEFPYSASLSVSDCALAQAMAHTTCVIVGAPIQDYGRVSIPYPTGLIGE
jgi:hypothetical protein